MAEETEVQDQAPAAEEPQEQEQQTRKAPEGMMQRDFVIERRAADIDEENRTAAIAFSSELPYTRSFGVEILDHKPQSVRMERLNAGAPLLVNHDPDQQVGVVESARIDPDGKGRAVVRFSNSARGSEIFDDVKSGIRRLVSVGYRIHDMRPEKRDGELETFRVVDWEPMELTLASVPADYTVGVGRASDTKPAENHVPERKNMEEQESTESRAEIVAEARRQVLKRNEEIEAIATRAKNEEVTRLANEYKANDRSLDEFRQAAFNAITDNAKPFETPPPPSEGMNKREMEQYSFSAAIRSCLPKDMGGEGGLSGLAREMSDEVAKRTGRRPQGFFVPSDVMHKRTLEVGTFTGAGALVGTTDGGQPLIELLRNNMTVVEMGATVLSGLQGDVDIPRQTGGGTANWLAEGATLTRADQTVGQLALRPKRLAAATAYSKQLLAQGSVDVENFVRQDLMQVIAIAKDLACLRGSGVSGQPQGIINTSGLSTAATHTSGGTFTWGQALDYESHVEDNNALTGSLGYLMRPADKTVAKATVRDSGGGGFVWDVSTNTINGYKAMATTQLTSGAGGTVFGNWADLIVADWDGMDIVVDPYSLSLNGQISIVVQTLTDCGVRHATSFSISAA